MKPFSAPLGESITGIPLVVVATVVSTLLGSLSSSAPTLIFSLTGMLHWILALRVSFQRRSAVARGRRSRRAWSFLAFADRLFLHSDMIRVSPMVS